VPVRRPIAVDLFCGVGGMGLGFEQAGFDVVAAVEHDPAHAGAHRFNFPHCEVIDKDVSKLDGGEVLRAVKTGLRRHGRPASRLPQIDVIFGGPPCQGFSVGGKLDAADPRNRLVERFVRLVEQLQPRAFVIENVPAMASRVLPGCSNPVPVWLAGRMKRAGYELSEPRVLNASRYGVPQDRRRLLLIGTRRGEGAPELPTATTAALPKRPEMRPRPGEAGHRSTHAGLANGPSVADAIGDLPDLDGFEELLLNDEVVLADDVLALSRALRSPYASRLAGDDRDPADLAYARAWRPEMLTSSMRTVHTSEVVDRFRATPRGHQERVSRLYRLHGDGLAPTLRAGSGPEKGSYSAPRPIHPDLDRVVSVREAARLHGFPDWFRFTAAKWHGFRQVGNAVPPPLAREIAVAVRDGLKLPVVAAASEIALGPAELLNVANGGGRPRRAKIAS
jgi:DNA (cytosine-5)-methyltransferase 1